MNDSAQTAHDILVDDAEIDRRIIFHPDLQIMEINFSGFNFDGSPLVNRFYDRIERRIRDTDEELWFFLINYSGCRIDSSAWITYARRGKELNLAHSMGSVRFDASEITRRQIQRSANTESFDANLFDNRDDAIERLKGLPSKRRKRVTHDPNYVLDDFVRRITFDDDAQIMDVDFAHFTFHHTRDVDDFYDFIEERIAATGKKWFFLINYDNCQILPGAWVRYAYRGKRLNIASSLGSVRYAPGSETEADIRMRAESQDFRPNIRNTREEAMERIREMKSELSHGSS